MRFTRFLIKLKNIWAEFYAASTPDALICFNKHLFHHSCPPFLLLLFVTRVDRLEGLVAELVDGADPLTVPDYYFVE